MGTRGRNFPYCLTIFGGQTLEDGGTKCTQASHPKTFELDTGSHDGRFAATQWGFREELANHRDDVEDYQDLSSSLSDTELLGTTLTTMGLLGLKVG